MEKATETERASPEEIKGEERLSPAFLKSIEEMEAAKASPK